MDQNETTLRKRKKRKKRAGRDRGSWWLKIGRVQRHFLDSIVEQKVSVAIFMVNGVRLVGTIDRYDMFAVAIRSEKGTMMIKIDAISTIAPLGKFRWEAPEAESSSD